MAANKKGFIVLMGSGELTSTMVEVHKDILRRVAGNSWPCNAIFLDTPAGFQLNVDELSQRAVDYFQKRIHHPLKVVSFKSKDIPLAEAERAYKELHGADYILVGPGSPTYAVRQWIKTPIPHIIAQRIQGGACFVAASAAALTVGKFTMPVYEIYKVGETPHWVEGMDILGNFGINAVVIPHWNNAEGGTHDTSRCFIGELRFRQLVSQLPGGTGIIGLDEHTACIIDLEREEAEVRGIGRVTIEYNKNVQVFQRGSKIPLDILRGRYGIGLSPEIGSQVESTVTRDKTSHQEKERPFWDKIHLLSDSFHKGLEKDPIASINALLELDSIIWKALQDHENPEFITQARDMFREFIVLLGAHIASLPPSREACIRPVLEKILTLRDIYRKNKKWTEADALRNCLKEAGIMVEDTPAGTRWKIER